MKNNLLSIWMTLSGCFLFGLINWAIFFLEKTEYQISIFAIVGAILTALTSVVTVTINNNKAKERELELLIVKEKQKAFAHFYNAYFEILKNVKKGKNNALTSKIETEMMDFKRGLMNWGSEDLIKAFLTYDNELRLASDAQNSSNILQIGDKFLKDLRKEMGFKDKGDVSIMSIVLTAQAREDIKTKR